MSGMNDLDLLLPYELSGGENERHFEQPFRKRVHGNAKVTGNFGKLAPARPSYPYGVTEIQQGTGDANGSIVGAAAFEQRIEVENAKRSHRGNPISVGHLRKCQRQSAECVCQRERGRAAAPKVSN